MLSTWASFLIKALAKIRPRDRFAAELAAALLYATALPVTAGMLGEQPLFGVLVSLMIAAMLLQVVEERRLRTLACGLAIAAEISVWLACGTSGAGSRMLLVAACLSAAAFFAVGLYGIVRAVLMKDVTGEALFGAVCGYVLLGIIWSLLFCAVETAYPESFRMSAASVEEVPAAISHRDTLTYFSFVTLSTVGYGDVTPVSSLARTLAWMEAVAGQLYLAILVAGLVGFRVARSRPGEG